MKRNHPGRARHERRLSNRALNRACSVLGLSNKNKPTIVPKACPTRVTAGDVAARLILDEKGGLRVAAVEGGYQLLVLNPTLWYPVVYKKQSEAVTAGQELFGHVARRLLKAVA
jgi:hypothetical protein